MQKYFYEWDEDVSEWCVYRRKADGTQEFLSGYSDEKDAAEEVDLNNANA